MRYWLIALAACLAGCTSTQPFQMDAVQSLTQTDRDAIGFKGLEFLADTIPGNVKPRVNVVYLHGIGWTEDPAIEALGQEFINGIATSYAIKGQVDAKGKCLRDDQGPQIPRADRLYITSPETIRYEAAIPGTFLTIDRLACVDRHVLDVSDTLEVAVYRVFWDDTFWNNVQFSHVGQDDDRGSSSEFAALRRKYNRRLKDEIVNYGFSDAVMYLGPTGATIREAVRGAICAAALDAGGYGFDKQGLEVSHEAACRLRQNTTVETNAFGFVSESLGSKIMYDLFRDALTDGREGPMDAMIEGTEAYLLANQIPLLSLSDVTTDTVRAAPVVSPSARPQLIAFSEINDFLTYEIVPFLEQLWKRSEHQDTRDFSDPTLREEIATRLGLDVIDVRVSFADPMLPMVNSFVNPLQAHKSHAGEAEIMRLILCGMIKGEVRSQGCLAARDQDGSDS